MQYFLAKTEPSTYSIDDLQKDKKTEWDGVNNALANRALKAMNVRDLVFIYHSGETPSIVGVAKVIKEAFPDPKNPKSFVPTFEFVKKFDIPILLSEIKGFHLFDDFALVRQGRLSTMPVPENFVNWIKEKVGDFN